MIVVIPLRPCFVEIVLFFTILIISNKSLNTKNYRSHGHTFFKKLSRTIGKNILPQSQIIIYLIFFVPTFDRLGSS
jgi:hypothetical protein